jgi:hypothetical protein
MTYAKDKPGPARDFDQLTGDPWQLGRISDAPADPEERQHWADAYDRGIETKLAQAGVLPSHPNYDDLYRQAVNGDYTHGVNGLAATNFR